MPIDHLTEVVLTNGNSLTHEIRCLIHALNLDDATTAKLLDFKKSHALSDHQWREALLYLYRQKLLECLEDHRLAEDEERYLHDLEVAFDLPVEDARRIRLELADTAMKRFAREVLQDEVLSDEEKRDFFRLGRFLEFPDEQIQDYLTGESLRYYTEFWDASSSIKVLDSSKYGQLHEFERNLRIKVESDRPTERDFARLKMLWMIKNGLMPRTTQGIFEEYDEVCHWSQNSNLYEESDSSHSVVAHGVHVARGNTYIVGSSRTHRFDLFRLRPKEAGEFGVTNHRVIFRGREKGLNVPFKMFLDVQVFQEGISIQQKGSGNRYFFELADVDLAASVLSGALQRMHE